MKRALIAATAALLTNTMFTAPALAAKPPIADTTGLSPQEVCDLQLSPSEHSEYQTEALNVDLGGPVNVGDPYFDPDEVTGPVGDPEGYGTPTYSNVFLEDSYFRNGGSPNVWAMAEATITYPQTRQLWNLLQDQTQTTTFDCRVWKYVGPESHENLVEPEGLQSIGNSSIEEQTVPAGTEYKITEDDFIIEGATVTALICISPNNVTKGKPGTWTKKHGFTGDCAAASIAAGGTVPSGNAPDLP